MHASANPLYMHKAVELNPEFSLKARLIKTTKAAVQRKCNMDCGCTSSKVQGWHISQEIGVFVRGWGGGGSEKYHEKNGE